jgi:hypothetical protein
MERSDHTEQDASLSVTRQRHEPGQDLVARREPIRAHGGQSEDAVAQLRQARVGVILG